jgi:hypothetical protein
MNPEARIASDSLIGLIQPFLDDELAPAERARVESVLAADPVLRDMVEEQRTVRQVLRDMPRETAPQALQARVLLELDAVDRERAAEAPAAKPARTPAWYRLRAFFRGAAIMVPAGATALALFLVTRTGTQGHVPEASQPAYAEFVAPSAPLVLGGAAEPSPGVRLVGASLPESDRAPTSVTVERQIGEHAVLDRHEPAGGPAPSAAHPYRGADYWLGRVNGMPAVAFESDGVRHTLTRDPRDARDGAPALRDDREYMFLLSLGAALRAAERPR